METPILELKVPWPLVNVEEENCELVVSFHAEAFLWPAVEEVGSVLLSLVDETDGAQFILNFGNVEHVTGVGVQKLVRLTRKLQSSGRRLLIKNVGQSLVNNFLEKGLTGQFAIRANQTCRFERLTNYHCK